MVDNMPVEAIRKEMAPSGRIRAAINRGNAVLVQVNSTTGELNGITLDLSRALAQRLDLPLDIVEYSTARLVADAAQRSEWDVAYLAIDPVRAESIDFTHPYVLIEGAYVVRANSKFVAVSDVDRANYSISVVQGSAYDLYLSRIIRSARLVRFPTGEDAIFRFFEDRLDVLAGVKQALARIIATHRDLRMLEPPFMTIEQAMATPKGRATAASYLRAFVEEMKSSGFIHSALSRAQQTDACVAPSA